MFVCIVYQHIYALRYRRNKEFEQHSQAFEVLQRKFPSRVSCNAEFTQFVLDRRIRKAYNRQKSGYCFQTRMLAEFCARK